MEVVVNEKRGGSMKSKLIMSFYRVAKPPTAATSTVKPRAAAAATALSVKTTSFPCSDDGYVHGPDGGGGDQLVDRKATSYISQVKQRLLLEESNLMINGNL